MLKVFLSSTFKDLIAERQTVEAAIQRMSAQYIGMEHFGSFAEEPLNRCLRKVRSADVLILVLGHEYGFIPKGSSISMVEAEYREAVKNNIPVLSYILHPSSDSDPKLLKFKKKIKAKHGTSSFTSPEDLAWKMISDLAREFSTHLSSNAPSLDNLGNQILVNPIKDRLGELIGILESRAAKIRRELRQFYEHAPVALYLFQFEVLHTVHINSLREGKLIQAHEVLSEIHKLSSKLEDDEFRMGNRGKIPEIRYHRSLAADALADAFTRLPFPRGKLVCEYIAGEMKDYSEKYSWDEGFGSMWGGGKISPTVSLSLYEKILSAETNS